MEISPTRIRVTPSPERSLLIYDGDCGFCQKWVDRWRRWTGDRVAYEPFQTAAARFPQIPKERFGYSVQFIERDGAVYEGAEAVFRSLSVLWFGKVLLAFYRYGPGFAWVNEKVYGWVARHRKSFSPSCEVDRPGPK